MLQEHRFVFIHHPEGGVKVQMMEVAADDRGAEGVEGGDGRFRQHDELLLQPRVGGALGQGLP